MTAAYLTGLVALHLVLTLIVIGAGTLIAAAIGVTNRLVLLMTGLVTFGVLGIVTFWIYLASAAAGRTAAIVFMIGCLIGCLLAGRRLLVQGTAKLVRPLLPPVAFFCAFTWFMTAIGYLRGGVTSDSIAGRMRFIPGLPDDNTLPLLLAKQLQDPTRPLPQFLARPWQASDRPPLQTGVYLLEQSVLGHDTFIHYQILSMIAQSLWVFGVWAVMVSARMANRAVALALAVTAFSGFTIVNTFFVWPKLFPAAYLMLAAAALLSRSFDAFRQKPGRAVVLGLCIGCAMLGHPGSLFVVIGLAVALLAVRAWPSRRMVVIGGAGIVVMYLPWMLFGKYYAPPGNFLEKWQLANIRNYFDHRPLTQTITHAYAQAGLSKTISNKLSNLGTPFRDSVHYPHEVWQVLTSQRLTLSGASPRTNYNAELSAYFYYVPALGFMSLGLVVALGLVARARWRGDGSAGDRAESLRVAGLSLVCLAVTWVIWSIVLFGPGTTTNHQSSYFMQLLGFCVGVIGWWLISPRLCAVLVVAQSAFAIWLYGLAPPALAGGAYVIEAHAWPSMLLLTVVSLIAAILSLRWLSRGTLVGFDDVVQDSSGADEKRDSHAVGNSSFPTDVLISSTTRST